MVNKLIAYINEHKLLNSEEVAIMTVSGGIDSIVLCHLLYKAKIPFVIAHCNFQLRGVASDADENFVRKLAKEYRVQFFVKKFNTESYATSNKVSIQVAARELRYQWFDEILKTHNFKAIATAHHRDDQIETFFINLMRGCGIAGLHGILPRRGSVIHPLLFASREDIARYAAENQLMWREDASNKSLKYLRNKIRHQLLPVLNDIEPNVMEIMDGNIHRLRGTEQVFRYLVEEQRAKVVKKDGKYFLFEIAVLLQLSPLSTFLFEFLSPFGFNGAVVDNVILSLQNKSVGNRFFSDSYMLIHDREHLVVAPKKQSGAGRFLINRPNTMISTPIKLKIILHSIDSYFVVPKENVFASFDAEKVKFPLALRKWRKGDAFVPFGMSGTKKISDFFTDNKLSFREKEETWLLCSEEQVIWVVGQRTDDRYKITKDSQKAIVIKLEK